MKNPVMFWRRAEGFVTLWRKDPDDARLRSSWRQPESAEAGHSDLSFTKRVYVHPDPQSLKAGSEKLSERSPLWRRSSPNSPTAQAQRRRAVDRESQSPASWAVHAFMAPSTRRIGAVRRADRSAGLGG